MLLSFRYSKKDQIHIKYNISLLEYRDLRIWVYYLSDVTFLHIAMRKNSSNWRRVDVELRKKIRRQKALADLKVAAD